MNIGEKINMLELISGVKKGERSGVFKCDCGNEKLISLHNVLYGRVKSCGCYRKISPLNRKHNLSNSKEYRTWAKMKERCYNKNSKDYVNYGARGIIVCDEWINSFETFLKDMGKKPSCSSIDRIDNNKGYCKCNCKWATRKEQNNNRRNNVKIIYNNKEYTIVDLSILLNLSYDQVRYLGKNNFTLKSKQEKSKISQIATINNGQAKQTQVFKDNTLLHTAPTLSEACRLVGLNPSRHSGKASMVCRGIRNHVKGFVFKYVT